MRHLKTNQCKYLLEVWHSTSSFQSFRLIALTGSIHDRDSWVYTQDLLLYNRNNITVAKVNLFTENEFSIIHRK